MTSNSLLLVRTRSLTGSSHSLTLAMSKKALQLIADNKKTKNPELSLSWCDLTSLPSELSKCVWLTELNLSFNSKLDDLSPLAALVNLQQLYCSNTQVTDLSPLAALTNLQKLHCPDTLVTDLSPLAGLTNLQKLDCSYTTVADLSPLAGLTNLQKLDCSYAPVADLSPLAGLTNLQYLHCSETLVADLLPLASLTNLQYLHCSETLVADLLPLASLTNLQLLDCSHMQVADLSLLATLTNLQQLSCSNTPVTDLSPLAELINLQQLDCSFTPAADLSPLAALTNLQQFDCSNTQVADLSPLLPWIQQDIPVMWGSDYSESHFINVQDCPLICPPVEIARDSPQAVRDYFEELGADGRRLNEVKVIFLGEASAGKTSLVKRLLGDPFDAKESQTHGIRIRKAPFIMDDGDQVTAHLWDFGGQEVMHATHQFFLSQRSVYVLLLNSRNDDQAEKWLKHADSFGGNSPVLVVLNKIDENPSFEVERKSLQEKHPQIQCFFRVSCAEENNKGFTDFQEALRREIDRADTRRTPFPAHWLAVKEHFSDMQADYIESAEYRRVCIELGVTRQLSQDVLLQFLHDLGVVINFRNLLYFDTQILNPLWLTNGVYRIINSTLLANNGGLLREAAFDAVINDPRYQDGEQLCYPKNKLHYIVRVMQEFELCFMLNERTYVVPQLLPVVAPDFIAEGAQLKFVIHFPEFLPDSVFPRLMVKLHTLIRGQERWRTGMVLHKPTVFNALARVRWDKEDRKIRVDVCGEERRRFLSYIRETVKEITADFSRLDYIERVPVPDCDEYKDYDELVEAEKAGEQEIFVKALKKRVSISALLDGVEEPVMRDEAEQVPVKAFVSYAHKDLEHLKTLRAALSPLMRLNKLQLWDDRDIDAGEEWRKVIFQQLEEADIVICLVSADFVNSDFCYQDEFGAALAAHRKGEKTIVPVMLRDTDWQDLPLSEIQGIPGVWINSVAKAKQDEAWSNVSKALRPALEQAKQRKRARMEKDR